MNNKRLLVWAAMVMLLAGCQFNRPYTTSPDGTLRVALSSTPEPSLDLFVDDTLVGNISHIGLEGPHMPADSGWKVTKITHGQCDSMWHQPWGENKEIREHYNAMTLYLKHSDDDILMMVEVRVFDDGMGFRYHYFGDSLVVETITGESTTFCFAHDGTCWSIPANFVSYEYLYREQPLSSVEDANTPMTIRFDNGRYCAIHEAALLDMPEMTLRRVDSLAFRSMLAPDNTGSGSVGRIDVGSPLPWRTLQIGRKPTDLINSPLILNLNKAPRGSCDTSHLRPMKYIGVWWGMHLGINSWAPGKNHGATTANALRYIDFAADNNIDAVLFEGWNLGWENWGGSQQFAFTQAAPDMDIDSVVRYAHSRGVEVIMHHETGANTTSYEAQLDEAFHWMLHRGLYAVKTGYAGAMPEQQLHHSLYGVKHYTRVMERAAKEGIMLDVHEPIKPTGLRRTYPILMTGEGVRGMEWNAWSEGNPPMHDATIPFTRMLAGPLDYTPGIFDITYESLKHQPHQQWNQQDASLCRVHTTLAHQVALWVVFYSPWVMAADLIENYEGHPMFEFFKAYDADCDWSKALLGEVGQYVVIVRRSGDRYFLGAITNEEGRTLSVPLDFLPEGIRYNATLYADAPDAHYLSNPTAYGISQKQLSADSTLTLHLAPGGGTSVIFDANK